MGQDAPVLFSGTFERSMDAKKRVAVPASWLSKGEGEVFHVVPHPAEGYLIVMPPAEFDSVEQKILASNVAAPEKRKAIRKFYGEAYAATTDKQGRILLNEKHCERAGLQTEVVFTGGRSRFEIWSKDRHTATDSGGTDALKHVAENIGL